MTGKLLTLDKEPFVSVLTPVYNGEKFLSECIESVLAQKYENWEYVIVNNCSEDRSLEIADKYAQKDDRIRIHNNREFLPQMSNLNHAFHQISTNSKYCKVIHADDMLFENCLTDMVAVAEEYPSIGIVSSYRLDGKTVGNTGLSYPSHFNDGKKVCRDFLLGNSYFFGSPSSLLIRSSIIQKREKIYDETYKEADISACLDILKESDFGFVHQVLTFTRRHEGSVTSSFTKKNATHMLGYLKMHLQYCPIYLSERESEKRIAKRIEIFYTQFARHLLMKKSPEVYKRHKKELRSVGLELKYSKLLSQLLRELIIQLFFKFRIRLEWVDKKNSFFVDSNQQKHSKEV